MSTAERSRSHCDCGNRAVISLNGYLICQRCYDMDKRKTVFATPDDWKLAYQWDNSDVDEACTRWLKKRGLYNEKGFGRLSYGQIESGLRALLDRI